MPRQKRKGQGLATQQQQQRQQEVAIKDLLEAGAHFGHQTQRWNPKMKLFIFGAKNGIHIIDLAKTVKQLKVAVDVVKDVIASNRSILFVGTKKAAKSTVRESAEACDEFYVCERWLGGTLTNLATIRQSVKKLERIEKRIAQGQEGITKKELSLLTKEQIKLEKNLSGVRGMRKVPGLLIIVDPSKEDIAVAEGRKLGIPIMALVDTNCNPDPIDYVIPCNDDAQRSIKLILDALTQAIIDKKNELHLFAEKEEEEEELEEEVDENQALLEEMESSKSND